MIDPIHHSLHLSGSIPLTKGVEPIVFYYTLEGANPHLKLEINANLTEVRFRDSSGGSWKFSRKHKKNTFLLDPKIGQSLSNLGTNFTSFTHPMCIFIEAHRHSEVQVQLPNGIKRSYTLEKQLGEAFFNKNRFYQLYLREEILSSKMVLKYEYEGGELSKISLFSPGGDHLIDTVQFHHKDNALIAHCYGKEVLLYQQTASGYTLFQNGLFLEKFSRPYEGIRGTYETAKGDYHEFTLENGFITEAYLRDEHKNLFISKIYKKDVFENTHLVFDSTGPIQVLEHDGSRVLKEGQLDKKNFLLIEQEVEEKRGVFSSAKELFLERVQKNANLYQIFFHHPTKPLLETKLLFCKGVLIEAQTFTYKDFDLIESCLYQDANKDSSTALDYDEKSGRILQGTLVQKIHNKFCEVDGVKKIQKRELSNGIREEYFFDSIGREIEMHLYINNQFLKKEQLVYDFCHRVIERSEEYEGSTCKKTSYYRYNEIGLVEQKVLKTPTRTLNSTLYFYNHIYELVEEWSLNGSDEIQNKTYSTYDPHSRRLKQINAFGEGVEYTYNTDGQIASQLDLLTGCKTTFSYDCRGLLIETATPRGSEKILYDRHKRPIECHDIRGGVRKQRWNSQGKIVEVSLSKSPNTVQTIRYKYDALGNLQEEIDPLGNRIRYRNDFKGNKKWIKMEGYEARFSYDHFGLMTEKQIQDKKIQEDFHDPLGRVVKTVLEGKETFFTYNGFDIVEENRFDGTKICYIYDDAGLPVEEIIEKGGARVTKKTTYDANQNPIMIEFVEKGQIIHRSFDKKNRLLEERIEDQEQRIFSYKKHSYDSLGALTEVSLLIDGKWSSTKKEFDIWGRQTAFIDPLGNKTLFLYEDCISLDGIKLEKRTKILPNQTKEVHFIDPFHELVSFCLYDPSGTLIKKENYKKDLKGNLVEQELIYQTLEGEKSQLLTYTYDSTSKLLEKVVDAKSLKPQIFQYTYDVRGRVSSFKKPSGTTLFTTYTDFNEIERVFSSDGSVDYRYFYDGMENLTEVRNSLTGQSTLYTYNAIGLVVAEELETGQLTRIEYDSNLEISAFHFLDAGSLYFTSGSFGVKSLTRETPKNGQIEFFFDKTQGGDALKKIDLPFGLGAVQFFYDLDGRLQKKVDFSGSDRIEKKNCFGSALKRGCIDPFKTYTQYYSYNSIDELEKFSDEPLDILYNGAGVPEFFGESKVYSDSKFQIRNGKGSFFNYDPQGNLFFQKDQQGSKEFRYDALDRLVEIDSKGEKIVFSYDFKHRLIQKKILTKGKEETIDYLYQNLQEVGAIRKENKELLEFRTLYPQNGQKGAYTLMVECTDKFCVSCHDIFQNLVGLFNPKSGKWEHFSRFSPFGKKTAVIQNIQSPWSYKQARYIPEADLFVFGMRYYDPNMHQFISKDPLGETFGHYGHRFCNNNPLKFIDPSGMAPIDSIDVDLSGLIQSFLNHLYEGKQLTWDSLMSHSRGEVLFPLEEFSKTLYATGSYLAKTFWQLLEKGRTNIDKRAQKAFRENQKAPYEKKLTAPLFQDGWHPLVHRIFPDGFFIPPINGQTYDLFTNGVGNSLLEAKESAKTVANHLQKEVFLVYNTSISLFHDVYRAAKNKISRAKGDVVHLLEKIAHSILEDPARNLRIWAHSEGALNTALALEQFPEEKKERLIVHTFGAAELIPKCFGGKVINFVSDKDAVSMGANMHILMNHSREKTTISFTQPIKGITVPVHEIQNSRSGHCYNIVFLRSKSTIDHFFKGESYQWALQLAQGYDKAA